MDEKKKKITRKDGIEYYRKSSQYDSHIHIRYSKDKIEKLKKVAKENDIKYNVLIRYIIDDFLNGCDFNEK